MKTKYEDELKNAPKEVGDAIRANVTAKIHMVEAGSTYKELADQFGCTEVKVTPDGIETVGVQK